MLCHKLQLEEVKGEDHEEAEEEEEEPEGAEPEEDLCELKWDGSSNNRDDNRWYQSL